MLLDFKKNLNDVATYMPIRYDMANRLDSMVLGDIKSGGKLSGDVRAQAGRYGREAASDRGYGGAIDLSGLETGTSALSRKGARIDRALSWLDMGTSPWIPQEFSDMANEQWKKTKAAATKQQQDQNAAIQAGIQAAAMAAAIAI